MGYIRNKFLLNFVRLIVVLMPGFLAANGNEEIFDLTIEGESMSEPHTVMVILESQQGKEELLKSALIKVAEQSRLEDSCLEYRFYQDKDHPHRFGLYEKWKSKELHQLQFSKPYILDFAKEAENLLEKPFEAIFGEEVTQ